MVYFGGTLDFYDVRILFAETHFHSWLYDNYGWTSDLPIDGLIACWATAVKDRQFTKEVLIKE